MGTINTPIRWKVVSPRAYYWGRRIMKPGQIFTACESDLPQEFKGMVVALDTIPITPEEVKTILEPAPTEDPMYRIKSRFDMKYDIVDSKGKKVNEKGLTKDEAVDMIKSLKT